MLRAITARLLIDGMGGKPLQDPVMLVDNGRIARISALPDVKDSLPAELKLTKFPGGTVIPGLIDAHVHLTFSCGRDAPETRRTLASEGAEQLALRVLANAHRALKAGVTTVCDCGGRGLVTLMVRDAINSGLVSGPRILTSGMPVTTTAGHLHWCGLRADHAIAARKAVRWLVEKGVDFVKVMGTGGHMTPISNYRMPQYTLEEMKAIVEEGHRLNRHVAVHVHATEGIRRAVNAGVDILEHCSWVGSEEGDDYDVDLVEEIVTRGIYVNLQRKAPWDTLGKEDAPTEEWERHAPWRDMVKRGATVVVSTDAGCSRTVPFDSLPRVVMTAIRFLGMSPMQALAACTGLAAKALRQDQVIGTLRPGKAADFVVLDGNPLEDPANFAKVRSVFVGGEEVVKEGRLII